MDLITDSSDYWAVGTFFAQNGNLGDNVYDERSNAFLANLAIDDLLPNDLSNVSIDVVLRFSEDTIEQRIKFQKELVSFREKILRCNNKQHARYIVGDFIKRLIGPSATTETLFPFFEEAVSAASSL